MFRVYSGAYDDQGSFAANCGFASSHDCRSEAGAVLYVCNKWPSLRLFPVEQVTYQHKRTVLLVFSDAEKTSPSGAIVCPAEPEFTPNWELWRPYVEGRAV